MMIKVWCSVAYCFVLFMQSVPCSGQFSVRIPDEKFISECLTNRQPSIRYNELCRKFLHNARKYTTHTESSRNKLYSDACDGSTKGNVVQDPSLTSGPESSVIHYLQALNLVANFGSEESLLRAVKDIGTCGRYFNYVLRSWRQYFMERAQQRSYPVYPASQIANESSTTVFFDMPRFYAKEKYDADKLSSVDVLVNHTPGSITGEAFGEYRLIGHLFSEKKDGRSEAIAIHESLQSICPSDSGRFFVGALNHAGIEAVAKWLRRDVTVPLRLKVNLEGEKMIMHCANHSFAETVGSVSENVIAIVLHFNVAQQENQLTPELMIVGIQGKNVRRRRSIRGCRRKPYVMNFQLHKALKVIDPTFFDVGECVGTCENLRQVVNSTNHAIGLQSEKHLWTSTGMNPKPTICCVPNSYRDFHYLTEDEYGVIYGDYRERMITEYCECR